MTDIKKIQSRVSGIANTAVKTASDTTVLVLSKAWIGISAVRPARTDVPTDWTDDRRKIAGSTTLIESQTPSIDRFEYTNMYATRIGDYYLPVSQAYNVRAKKRLNISSLIDGADIIQQTRKEAKVIDCTLRISVRDDQDNLQILSENQSTGKLSAVRTLEKFLLEFYENDTILEIQNDYINNVCRTQYVLMEEYEFTPQPGKGTYLFRFSLREIQYGENVLTFNLREVDPEAGTQRQIIN